MYEVKKQSWYFVGDSRTWFIKPSYWPSYVIGRNIGIRGLNSYNQMDVIETCTRADYDVSILSIGINDQSIRVLSETVANLYEIIQKLKTMSKTVYITNVPGVCVKTGYYTEGQATYINAWCTLLNAEIPAIATAEGITMIDICSVLTTDGVYLREDLCTDGIHWESAGYAIQFALYESSIPSWATS